mgnify:CR=1 FL=1
MCVPFSHLSLAIPHTHTPTPPHPNTPTPQHPHIPTLPHPHTPTPPHPHTPTHLQTDAVLRVTSSAICGSDLHLYLGSAPGMQRGDVLGHEFMGFVEEVGPEVGGARGVSESSRGFLYRCRVCRSVCAFAHAHNCARTHMHTHAHTHTHTHMHMHAHAHARTHAHACDISFLVLYNTARMAAVSCCR